MKKLLATAMITTMLCSSHAVISHAETNAYTNTSTMTHAQVFQNALGSKSTEFIGTNQVGLVETNPLKEQKRLTSEKIFTPEFSTLSIQERLTLLQQYVSLQKELYSEYQIALISGKQDVQELKKSILQDNRSIYADHDAIQKTLKSVYDLPLGEKKELKEEVRKLISDVKEARESGRKLYDSILLKEQADNASQITLLNQTILRSLKNQNFEQAIESLSKVSVLSGGDVKVIDNLQELLKEESLLLFENAPYRLEDNLIKENDKWLIQVDALKEIAPFDVLHEVKEEEETTIESWKISFEGKTLEKLPDQVLFNNEFIGNPQMFKEIEGDLFVDVAFFFELFGYNVSIHGDAPLISTPVFKKSELDNVSTDELVKSLF